MMVREKEAMIYDVMLNSNLKFLNKKINKMKMKMRKENKINRVHCLHISKQ